MYFMANRQPAESAIAAATTPPQTAREKEKGSVTDVVTVPKTTESVSVDSGPTKIELPHASLEEQLAATLVARDRALASKNLLGAKAVLQTFLNKLPPEQLESEPARVARRELDVTTKLLRRHST